MLAWSSSSGPAISASALKKLPELKPRVTPNSIPATGRVQLGAWPASATIASSAAALVSWSITINTRLRVATSSHAPRNGPANAPGRTVAAAVAPASGPLPVRSSTSSTPAVLNIVAVIRDSATVTTKPG